MGAADKRDRDKLQIKQECAKFFYGKEFYIERMPFAQKSALTQRVRAHGGKVSFSVTRTTQYVVTCESASVHSQLSKYKLGLLLRANAVVVDAAYVDACVNAQALVEVTPFLVAGIEESEERKKRRKGEFNFLFYFLRRKANKRNTT
jgi:hypothetical protein